MGNESIVGLLEQLFTSVVEHRNLPHMSRQADVLSPYRARHVIFFFFLQ